MAPGGSAYPGRIPSARSHPIHTSTYIKPAAALLQLAKQVREEVAQLASDYQFEVAEQHYSRTIMAEFTLLWTNLEDSRPHKLRAYGTINPKAHTILGPRLQRLIDLVLAIDEVASGKQKTMRTQQESDESDVDGKA